MRISFDFFALTIILFTQWHMCRRLLRAARSRLSPGRLRLGLWIMGVFYAVMMVAFASAFSFLVSRLRLAAAPMAVIGAVGQIWFFGSTASWLLYSGFRLLTSKIPGNEHNPARRRFLNTGSAALAAAPFALVGYGAFIERLNFRVRQVDVAIPELPRDLDGLRLVQLSDIHLSAFLSEKDLARVVDSANELRGHLALVTGDLITAGGDPLDACLRHLSRLRSDAGILGCMGNHEDYAEALNYCERVGAQLGIRFLRKRAQPLRFGSAVLNVAGVDYQRAARREGYLRGAEQMVQLGAYNVLLSHNPDVFPVAAEKGYDLTLSGHTHGGQVTVEILHEPINPARFFTPFVYGLYRQGTAAAYVTRGIGTIGVPARVGAPPEIALVCLRKA